MFMRYRGGAIGHKSTQDATRCIFEDRDPLDKDAGADRVDDEDGELDSENKREEEVNLDGLNEEKEEEEEEEYEEEGEDQCKDGEDRDMDDDGSENDESHASDSEPGSESGSISDEMEGFDEL